MKVCAVIAILFTIIPIKYASAASTAECKPQLEASWSYDPSLNSSELVETFDNLSEVFVHFDFGFLKLSDQQTGKNLQFRQVVVSKIDNNPSNLIVRYESTSRGTLNQISVLVTDPMCTQNDAGRISIFKLGDLSFTSTIYKCKCLSQLHDSGNFVD